LVKKQGEIMSFWGQLFGSNDSTKEVISAVRDGVDSLWYTDEEKATDKAIAVTEGRRVLLDWIKNSQGQNLSRRFLAISITLTWLMAKLIGVGLGVASVWGEGRPDDFDIPSKLEQAAGIVSEFSSDMTPAVMLILSFYFAAPHMGKIAEATLARFGDRNSKGSKDN
jgi:hypothetical protein